MIISTPSLRATLLLAIGLALLLTGCGNKLTSGEADALRRKVLELEKENDLLTLRSTELEAELKRQSLAPESLPLDIRESLPALAGLEINRLSHALDENDDGISDTLEIYVEPRDGRGRFIQMTGHLSVHVAMLPADADAFTIGRLTLTPSQLREAYRSGFSGTHYTIRLPITLKPPGTTPGENLDSRVGKMCLLRVIYLDGVTGIEHSARREIKLSR